MNIILDWITPYFWLGLSLTFICIFQLEPLSTEKIKLLKEWDDLFTI